MLAVPRSFPVKNGCDPASIIDQDIAFVKVVVVNVEITDI
jgi:hypothetical protein